MSRGGSNASLEAQAQKIIGPRPEGDPVEMRAQAGKLTLLATELETQAKAIEGARVPGDAPYVHRTNAHASDHRDDVAKTANEVTDWAGRLTSEANALEEAQKAYDSQLQQQLSLLTAAAGRR